MTRTIQWFLLDKTGMDWGPVRSITIPAVSGFYGSLREARDARDFCNKYHPHLAPFKIMEKVTEITEVE